LLLLSPRAGGQPGLTHGQEACARSFSARALDDHAGASPPTPSPSSPSARRPASPPQPASSVLLFRFCRGAFGAGAPWADRLLPLVGQAACRRRTPPSLPANGFRPLERTGAPGGGSKLPGQSGGKPLALQSRCATIKCPWPPPTDYYAGAKGDGNGRRPENPFSKSAPRGDRGDGEDANDLLPPPVFHRLDARRSAGKEATPMKNIRLYRSAHHSPRSGRSRI
jgi:hypothetical protein